MSHIFILNEINHRSHHLLGIETELACGNRRNFYQKPKVPFIREKQRHDNIKLNIIKYNDKSIETWNNVYGKWRTLGSSCQFLKLGNQREKSSKRFFWNGPDMKLVMVCVEPDK